MWWGRGEGRDALRSVVLNTGLECSAEDCVPFKKILPRLVLGNVDVVLIDIGAFPQAAMEAIHAASLKSSVPVLAIGSSADSNLILQAHKSGARQFLDRSQPPDELISAMAMPNLRAKGEY